MNRLMGPDISALVDGRGEAVMMQSEGFAALAGEVRGGTRVVVQLLQV